jgi:hypothetical protein
MYIARVILYGVLLVTLFVSVNSLDVSWIPSDPDGPLPLSRHYRKSLRTLCTQIKSGVALPSEIEGKKAVLSKMCAQLERDDGVSDSGTEGAPNVYVVAGLVIAGILYFGNSAMTQLYSGKAINTAPIKCSESRMKEAREARVRKFEAENKPTDKVD